MKAIVVDRYWPKFSLVINRRLSSRSLERIFFAIFLLVYCVYAGIFISHTSFVFAGERFFVLADDSMISMRYAKNLAAGYGLVWNPGGELVEGYSNFLWTLVMTSFHLLNFHPSKISLYLQIVGAILLMLNLIWVWKIAGLVSKGSPFVCVAAVILTGFYFPLNYWGLMGYEVSLLVLLVSLSVWEALKNLESDKLPIWLYLLFVVGLLTRDDMLPFFLGITVFLFIVDHRKRYRHLLVGGTVLAAVFVGHTAFRWFYYGDVLPNTYYLKLVGYPILLRLSCGLIVFLGFLLRMNLSLLLLLLVACLVRRDKLLALLAWLCLIQSAYSIYVGGDAWEQYGWSNRYLSVVIPLLFILITVSLGTLIERWNRARLPLSWNGNLPGSGMKLVKPVLVLMILFSLNAYDGLVSLRQWVLLSPAPEIEYIHRSVIMGLRVQAITNPEAKVAVIMAGAAPYFMDRIAIDLLGKNDRWIAHRPMLLPDRTMSVFERLTFFRPGHLKIDYVYAFQGLQPDVVMQIWKDRQKALDLLADTYMIVDINGSEMRVFLKEGSPNIRWDVLPSPSGEHKRGKHSFLRPDDRWEYKDAW